MTTVLSTITSTRPFRLLDLPAELRLTIYEHYFANTNLVPGAFPTCLNISGARKTPQEPPLLTVSSHVRAEALQPYLSALQWRSKQLRLDAASSKQGRDSGNVSSKDYGLQYEIVVERLRVLEKKIGEVQREVDGVVRM